jgi:hypothetical protein
MLIIGAKRCVGSLGMRNRSTSVSRQKLRPPVHGRPVRASACCAPAHARISCERREMQIARLPVQ